jgi:hypothetical protein
MTDPRPPILESLESRIAPAVIGLAGAPGVDATDIEYSDVPVGKLLGFHQLGTGPLGASLGADANTYYMVLATGDKLRVFDPVSNYQDFITVKSGNAVAFFVDANLDNEVQRNELTGLSLGNNADVVVLGTVNGSVVGNYNDLTKTIVANSLVSEKQAIKGLFVSGSVNGSVLAGGAISAVNIVGQVDSILTGSATNTVGYDFNGVDAGGSGTIALVPTAKSAGGAITTVTVGSVDLIQSGNGGASAAGGAIKTVTVTNDTDGFFIIAGNGGNGIVSSTAGGVGGAVSSVLANLQNNTDSTDNDSIVVQAGNGGSAFGAFTGGAGGAVSTIKIGYTSLAAKAPLASSFHNDNVYIYAGNGGAGKVGGAGGALSAVTVATSAPDAVGTEIAIYAGTGGAANAVGGKGGAGGALSTVDVRLKDPTALASSINIGSGAGGSAAGFGAGGNGGALSGITVTAFNFDIFAGSGGSGTTAGGNGGAIKTVNFVRDSSIIANNFGIYGGQGGLASAGKGGIGGAVGDVFIRDADLLGDNFIFAGSGGTGNGTTGAGGVGGNLSKIVVNDIDSLNGAVGLYYVFAAAGNGGQGSVSGGAGGSLADIELILFNADATALAGNGGNSTVAGIGGAGGKADRIVMQAESRDLFNPRVATLIAGDGGDGSGAKGSGGLGGSLTTVNLFATANATALAGAGGDGNTKGGAGGAVSKAGLLSESASAYLYAGNGGNSTTAGGAGGSITSSTAFAFENITVLAGDGLASGLGGSITTLTFGNESVSNGSVGNIVVAAGDGSAVGTKAGVGGNLTSIVGFASTGIGATTQISAGNGGSIAGAGANGGSLSKIFITGGGAFNSVLTIDAGNGGNALGATKAGNGGNVTDVAVNTLEAGTIFRRVAAGEGGDAAVVGGTGGNGGTITKVNVGGDIGVRSGEAFGFNTMGGLFAGSAGSGAKVGIAGSVTSVTANAISSIVAGHSNVPQLAKLVDSIYLRSFVKTTTNAGAGGAGPFDNFNAASLVGGVVDPLVANANDFDRGGNFVNNAGGVGTFDLGDQPLDGLIAAAVLGSKRNFAPEAFLTTTGLVDNLNPA